MRSHRLLLPFASVAAAAFCLTTSCSSSAGVDPFVEAEGRYTLRTIDGSTLPAIVQGRWVLQLTLTLTRDRRAILRGFDHTTAVPTGPAPVPTFREDVHITGTYQRSDSLVALYAGTGVYVNLATGWLSGADTLRLDANAGTLQDPLWIRYLYVREDR
jgi:hypothetical protein